jgi:hypothetical protein
VPIASVSLILGIVVAVLAALLIVLFLGGLIANARRRRLLAERLAAQIEAADGALAQARASDRGWERAAIERAAREAFAAAHPDRPLRELQLIRVVDRPGTDADQAVFRAIAADGGEETLTLGRRAGAWVSVEA